MNKIATIQMATGKVAVFPGSFDPITSGHENLIRRALPLFDKVIVGIGVNSYKKAMYSVEKRTEWLAKVFAGEKKIGIAHFEGLTVDFCKKEGASYILRGLRTAADFEFERIIAQMNKAMAPEIETVFILSAPEFSAISSTVVREIIRFGGDVSPFIPKILDL